MGNDINNLFSKLGGSDVSAPYSPSVYYNLLNGSLPSDITFTRAGITATYFNSSGVLTSAGANVPRFDYDPATLNSNGLLLEWSNTNYIRNNTMLGAVAGTPGTPPTNWGINAVVSGISSSIIGTGTESGIDYIDVRLSGTTSGAGSLFIIYEGATSVPAVQNDKVSLTNYIRLVGGSTANLFGVVLNIKERDGAGGPLVSADSSALSITSGNLATYRPQFNYTMTNASAAFALPELVINWTGTGVAIDITLRIGLPQIEKGKTFASSVIKTSGAAVTRNQDFATVINMPWFNALNGSFKCEFMYKGLDTGGTTGPVVFDTDINNRIGIGSTVANHPNGYVVNGGVVGTITDTYSTWSTNSVILEGLTYKAGANVMAVNEVANATGTFASSGIPSVNTLRFGRDASGAGATGNCMWLKNFSYFNYPLPSSRL